MMTVFIAGLAFSLGLIAFCASIWLTAWASNTSTAKYPEMSAAKLAGYFVTSLSILSLIFTSYYTAKAVMLIDTTRSNVVAPTKARGATNRPGMLKGKRLNHANKNATSIEHDKKTDSNDEGKKSKGH